MKFLADRMLGKLAKKLRLLGFDAAYYTGEDPIQLLRLGRQEERTILTRNTKIVPRRAEDRIVQMTHDIPSLQLRQLVERGTISLDKGNPLSRCLLCNMSLEVISKKEVEGKVPDYIFHHQDVFFHCTGCHRIYWRGSHHENMKRWTGELFQSEATSKKTNAKRAASPSNRT